MNERPGDGVTVSFNANHMYAAAAHPAWPVHDAALWQVLQRQALLYTGGDSTSLPAETVAELLQGVLLCVQVGDSCLAHTAAAAPPLAQRLLAGQRALWLQAQAGKKALARLRPALLHMGSQSLQQSVKGLAVFFKWYDVRFMAHAIPADIDYPLYLPVDEALQGVLYIAAWMERLAAENSLCAAFGEGAAAALLARARPGYRAMPLNIFEPVFTAALGCALLGTPPTLGGHTAAGCARLQRLFYGKTAAESTALLQRAAGRLCTALHLWNSRTRGYMQQCARTLAPRLPGLDKTGWQNLFCGV